MTIAPAPVRASACASACVICMPSHGRDHMPPGVADRLRTTPRGFGLPCDAPGPTRRRCEDAEPRHPPQKGRAPKKRLDPGALPRAGATLTPRPWTVAAPFGHATLEEPPSPRPAPGASRQRPMSAPSRRHDPKRHLSSRVPGLADPREVSDRGGLPRSALEAGTSNQRDFRSNGMPHGEPAACRNEKVRALFRNLHHAPRMTTESCGGAMMIY